MNEIYKDVAGYEGRYKVSNLGNVMSVNYLNKGISKVLSPVKHHTGYLYVHLGADNMRSIHRLVASAFIDNPNGYNAVNHIDGNKHNNCAKNLEWVTSLQNIRHAISTGLRDPHINNHPKGSDTPNSRPILQISLDGDLIKRWDCISDAARSVGCNPAMIINVARGRHKQTHGYIWKYEE